MSPSNDTNADHLTLPERPWHRGGAIVALFVILGPPMGGLVAGLSLAAVSAIGGDLGFVEAVGAFLPTDTIFNPTMIKLVYALGVVPAIICGLIVAWYEGWRGPVTGFSAILLGTGVGAVTYMVSEFAGLENAVYGAIFNIFACLVPCYLLTRLVRLWARRDPPVESASDDSLGKAS